MLLRSLVAREACFERIWLEVGVLAASDIDCISANGTASGQFLLTFQEFEKTLNQTCCSPMFSVDAHGRAVIDAPRQGHGCHFNTVTDEFLTRRALVRSK